MAGGGGGASAAAAAAVFAVVASAVAVAVVITAVNCCLAATFSTVCRFLAAFAAFLRIKFIRSRILLCSGFLRSFRVLRRIVSLSSARLQILVSSLISRSILWLGTGTFGGGGDRCLPLILIIVAVLSVLLLLLLVCATTCQYIFQTLQSAHGMYKTWRITATVSVVHLRRHLQQIRSRQRSPAQNPPVCC
jgi:hypothetical protein